MADEAAAYIRRQERQKVERNGVAEQVGEDLASYIGTHPPGKSIEISVHENVVSLRKKTTSDTLEITYTEYEVFEVTMDGKFATSGDQSAMTRCVIDWLKR